MENREKEAALKKVRNSLSLFRYYSRDEAMTALLINDVEKLDEMRKVYEMLASKLSQFEKILLDGSDEEISIAIRTFQKPRL